MWSFKWNKTYIHQKKIGKKKYFNTKGCLTYLANQGHQFGHGLPFWPDNLLMCYVIFSLTRVLS